MDRMSAVVREAPRLARLSTPRTRVIGGTIFIATLVGVLLLPLSVACAAVTLAIVIVARRSPRSERRASTAAWTRAGAGRFANWAVGAVEAMLVAWSAIALGLVSGLTIVSFTRPTAKVGYPLVFVAVELALVSLAACLPTTNERDRRSRIAARPTLTVARVLTQVLVTAAAVFGAYQAATHVRTNLDLAFAGAIVIALLVVAGVIVTGPAQRGGVGLAVHIPKMRPLGALARRAPARGTVRLVVVGALTVAAGASVLGASVGARPETFRALDAKLARLPTLPPDVALVRLDSADPRAALPPDLVRALDQSLPGVDVISLRHVEIPPSSCLICDLAEAEFVIADPRLRDVYGAEAEFPPAGIFGGSGAAFVPVEALSRAPIDLVRRVHHSGRLPAYTFADAVFFEVPSSEVVKMNFKTSVRSLFVHAPRALTGSEIARVTKLVRSAATRSHARLRLIGAHGELVPVNRSLFVVGQSASLRQAPWAATSSSDRWLVALIAALTALVTLFVSLTIDTIDRRREAWRLERLGATPGQIRGAAALSATTLVAAATWMSLGLAIWLVRAGTLAFNRREPLIAVPFTVPWPVLLFLAVVVPALAGALAAATSRPFVR